MAFSRVRSMVTAALAASSTACLVSACGGGSVPETASPAQASALAQHTGLFGIVNDNVDLGCAVFGACSAATTVTGIFDDAPTQGITYACSPSLRGGVTDASGRFTCAAQDSTVSFTLPMVDGSAIELGSSDVPPYDGVHVPVTALRSGTLNVGMRAAEILQALNQGNDALMDVGGVDLPAASVAQVNAYILGAGVLPAGVASDDDFLAGLQAQAGAVNFTHRVTGHSNSFLYATVLPHLQDTVVAISASNPAPAPDAQGQARLSGTIVVSGNGNFNVPGCAAIPWSATGGGVLDAVVGGDIGKAGQYPIAITSPGFSETVTLGPVDCPPADPIAAQTTVVAVPPFAAADTLAVTPAFVGYNLALSAPANVPLGCVGGNINGTNIGAANPLVTMGLAIMCDFGFGPMHFGAVMKLVGAG
jgi:hypothetical protein